MRSAPNATGVGLCGTWPRRGTPPSLGVGGVDVAGRGRGNVEQRQALFFSLCLSLLLSLSLFLAQQPDVETISSTAWRRAWLMCRRGEREAVRIALVCTGELLQGSSCNITFDLT